MTHLTVVIRGHEISSGSSAKGGFSMFQVKWAQRKVLKHNEKLLQNAKYDFNTIQAICKQDQESVKKYRGDEARSRDHVQKP